MHSTLIVARLEPSSIDEVGKLFADFDRTGMPRNMGTVRRQLFSYQGLYFHLQDFESDDGGDRIAAARSHPLFVGISEDLKQHITAYDPATWRSPADAIAQRFYHWEQ
ncbi:TcmI family type II polyketide cyclase [Streptomyces sp. NBC_01232]|uniref:TcmI family type II polyketide cyclase n=1 Tax=unclassified Streptomyces TaxID=2593676 RepID=UPI002E0D6AC9|nr:TcmI family type II polyketide cyclase [Streptomyces sp. NBC_01232]